MELLTTNAAPILVLLFMLVTFLQSGLDKLTDWKGNLAYITDHFKNSPLGGFVPALLATIAVLEVVGGVLMLVGVFQLATSGQTDIAFYGLVISAITLIFLLIGQRMAKDYAGAMTLAVYFIISIFGLHFLAI